MKDTDGLLGTSSTRYSPFTWVKYLVYALLSFNVYLFLQEELGALEHTFVHGFELGQIIQVFSATIDTTAWVVLLLLFELETSILDDARIRGPVKWLLHGLRLLCYAAVFYAFTGYYAELVTLYQVTPLAGFDACNSLDQGLALLLDLDEYEPLSAANCVALTQPVYRLEGFDIVAQGELLREVRWLAWTDVINSATWLLVVIVLEVEVRLQLRGNLSDRIMRFTLVCKYALYGTLFGCAGYWGVAGDFLDFWDAALWLFAFIFIELNVFEWQAETSQEAPQAA
ncbi:hypothetical protein DWB85_11115 [Seongchinamella sediminis]|uniref:Shikimate kinase n=1 Tax=Seongchinamella sediminis TaxID=2283635 RepID=A0A3L7DW68_9GAMM|nr:hypothetical protein [Seongchinamella sediminis]RLQ21828.1 hypothetical protein DWB85_11115 [Seongchinamella sediminis]